MGGYFPPEPKTLCWGCAKACTSGCSWAERLEPVKGWVAQETEQKTAGKGYLVLECPEYVKETPETKNRELVTDNCLKLIERLMEVNREDYIKGSDETRNEIRRFIRDRRSGRMHQIGDPEGVIRMLDAARTEYLKQRAKRLMSL